MPKATNTSSSPRPRRRTTRPYWKLPFNLQCNDLDTTRQQLQAAGHETTAVSGDEQTCFWFTTTDPDGNTLLLVDR